MYSFILEPILNHSLNGLHLIQHQSWQLKEVSSSSSYFKFQIVIWLSISCGSCGRIHFRSPVTGLAWTYMWEVGFCNSITMRVRKDMHHSLPQNRSDGAGISSSACLFPFRHQRSIAAETDSNPGVCFEIVKPLYLFNISGQRLSVTD